MSQSGKVKRLASSSTRGACLAKRHTTSSLPLPRGARAVSASLVDLEGYLREQEGAGPGRHGGAGSPREQVRNPFAWLQEVTTQHERALRQVEALQEHVLALLKSKVDSWDSEIAERQRSNHAITLRMSGATEQEGWVEQGVKCQHQRWLTSGVDSRRKSVPCECGCEERVLELEAANRALAKQAEELTTRCDSLVVITAELGCQNSLLREKMHQLNSQLAGKDDQLADQGEELEGSRVEVGRLQELVKELEGELQSARLLQGEVECWKEKHQFVLAALADKEAVIMELLDRVHLLEGADPEGTGGVGVSEDLMNHNQKLEGTISWLENQLRLREEHISSLKVELLDQQDKYKRMTLSLDTAEHQRRVLEMMEMRQDLLRATLSDKDSKMASLEGKWLRKGRSQVAGQLARLRVEREELVTELKGLHQKSMAVRRLVKKDSASELYLKCRGASKEQVLCEVLRLNSTADKLKQFIDYFLSVVMETNPSLLAGMPSLQHNTGVQPQILTTAGKSELLLEVESQEQGCRHLQHYVTILLSRVADRDPALLDHLMGRGRGQRGPECPL